MRLTGSGITIVQAMRCAAVGTAGRSTILTFMIDWRQGGAFTRRSWIAARERQFGKEGSQQQSVDLATSRIEPSRDGAGPSPIKIGRFSACAAGTP